MFTQEVPNEYNKLNEAIERHLDAMAGVDCGSDDYAKMADQLVKLYKAKETDFSLKLKEFEAIGKQNELEEKLLQSARAIVNKETETEKTLKLRDIELALKKMEIDSSAELKAAETEAKKAETQDRRRVSSDTLALIAANVAGIIMIIGYERVNVIASKALGFVGKVK